MEHIVVDDEEVAAADEEPEEQEEEDVEMGDDSEEEEEEVEEEEALEELEEGDGNRNRNRNRNRPYMAPPELKLSELEKDWAWDLIERVEGPAATANWNDHDNDDTTTTTRLRAVTDFEYASYVLVTGGNMEEAVRRMQGMQQFRDYYNIQDTVEEGVAVTEEFIRLQPGCFLYVDVLGPKGSVIAWDYGAFIAATGLASARAWRVHALFCYYQSRMHQATLQAVREGVIFLGEGDMSWENVDTNFSDQMDAELFKHDPVKFKRIMIYNTNSIANMAFNLFKPVMARPIRDVLQLGCQIEYDHNPDNPKLTLKDIYFQPTYDIAMKHLVQRARSLLEMRYRNERDFRLS